MLKVFHVWHYQWSSILQDIYFLYHTRQFVSELIEYASINTQKSRASIREKLHHCQRAKTWCYSIITDSQNSFAYNETLQNLWDLEKHLSSPNRSLTYVLCDFFRAVTKISSCRVYVTGNKMKIEPELRPSCLIPIPAY